MAIAVLINCPGVTLKQYDDAVELGGFLPGGPLPPEGLFHWVTKTEDGILVVNVWESMEGFEKFADTVASLMDQVGVQVPPDVQIFEVHNYLAGARWGR
jgi:hypothetical protein